MSYVQKFVLPSLITLLVLGVAIPVQGDTLISVDVSGDQLVTVDTETGTVTPIGPLGVDVLRVELAVLGDRVLMLSGSPVDFPPKLYELNITTGGATLLATVDAPSGVGDPSPYAEGLSVANGQLIVAFKDFPPPFANTSNAIGDLALDGTISNVTRYGGLTDLDLLTFDPAVGKLYGSDSSASGPIWELDHPNSATLTLVNDVPYLVELEFIGSQLFGLSIGPDGSGRNILTFASIDDAPSEVPYDDTFQLHGLALAPPSGAVQGLSEIGTINFGVDIPSRLELSGDEALLYVTLRGPNDNGTEGSFAVVDTATNSIIGRVPINTGSPANEGFPTSMAVAPAGDRVFVAVSKAGGSIITLGTNRVDVVDVGVPENPTVVDSFPTPGGNAFGPTWIVITPDGATLYLTDRGNGTVHVMDAATGAERTLPAGLSATGIAITPTGEFVYVTVASIAKVLVIDTMSKNIVETFPLSLVTARGWGIDITPDGTRAYVTSDQDSRVAVINLATNMETETIDTTGTSGRLVRIAISDDGRLAFVTSRGVGEVVIVDVDPSSLTFNQQVHAVAVSGTPFAGLVTTSLPSVAAYVATSGHTISLIGFSSIALAADAGADQTVDEDELVTLDGSGSSPGATTFSWSQLAGPFVALDLSDPVGPTFIAPYVPANETLTFELTVNDGLSDSDPDTVDITVVNVNSPPIADAGNDSTIKEGAIATLDGSNSYDPDGDTPLSYNWWQVAGPPVTLRPDNAVESPNFVAPVGAGSTVVIKLQVSDGKEVSALSPGGDSSFDDTASVTIVLNSPPTADAGADQTKDEGSGVTLNGLGSSDPDGGDSLSYQWTQIGGSPVVLAGATGAVPTFDAPAVMPGGEDFDFKLVVTDDDPVNPLSSAPDVVTINVTNLNDPPRCDLAVPSSSTFWPPNHKMQSVTIEGVTDDNSTNEELSVQILSVTQDEPVNGLGDGDSSPDAIIQSGASAESVLVRAERAGGGNGRVYVVMFVADDGFESCQGSISVSVPHNRKSQATDDGQLHDSTQP